MGKYYGSLPKISTLTAEDNPLLDTNMLEPQTQAPKPQVQEDEEDEDLPDLAVESDDERPTLGTHGDDPTREETGGFVGYVENEEEMENQFIYYRPSSGKKVLVVDRVKNECFFLKWKTFNKDQRKGRELDPRHFGRVERQKLMLQMPKSGNPSWIQEQSRLSRQSKPRKFLLTESSRDQPE